MNSGEIITTEINTEIKLEVHLETASIVKVETKPLGLIENSDIFPSTGKDMTTLALEKERKGKELEDKSVGKIFKQTKKPNASSGDIATEALKNSHKEINNDATSYNLKNKDEKTREHIKEEREAKRLAKQAAKAAKTVVSDGSCVSVVTATQQLNQFKIDETSCNNLNSVENSVEKKKSTLTKADRRAIQEAQRAVKAQAQAQSSAAGLAKGKTGVMKTTKNEKDKNSADNTCPKTQKLLPHSYSTEISLARKATSSSPLKTLCFNDGNVKLFSHLEKPNTAPNLFVNNLHIHPCIARLGEQYVKRTIVGSNARCMAFLSAIKTVIHDYETPPKREFHRSLESFIVECVDYLQKCRALAVSVINAHKSLKQVLMQLPKEKPESELKERLITFIDTYIENQIGKAAQAINSMMQKKINNDDVILTFGCSSLINYICEEAQARRVNFRVIVVDSRPFCEGRELLRRLAAKEVPCSYILINAVSFVMPEVTKVLLGAHALLANGYVMARTGTAQVALVARSFNVPVLVCCETHKFSERFQTDAIVYNEVGNPDDIVVDEKCCLSNWQAKHKMSPLNLNYDITPPELVTAVVTEVSVLPCTSVPVILRMKPDWLV